MTDGFSVISNGELELCSCKLLAGSNQNQSHWTDGTDGIDGSGNQFSAFQSELFEENYTILRNNYQTVFNTWMDQTFVPLPCCEQFIEFLE